MAAVAAVLLYEHGGKLIRGLVLLGTVGLFALNCLTGLLTMPENKNSERYADVAASLEKAKKGLHNGAVYLFHCVGSTNPAILGDLIDYIRAEGYEIRPMTN